MSRSPGQVNYDAYADRAGGRSLISGTELPEWEMLPSVIQDAWEAGANAVLAADAETRKAENKLPG